MGRLGETTDGQGTPIPRSAGAAAMTGGNAETVPGNIIRNSAPIRITVSHRWVSCNLT